MKLNNSSSGEYKRVDSGFRQIVSQDHPIFKPEPGRYHLYVSYACPWANRTLIVRNLKGLQDFISLSVVHPTWQKTKENESHTGWVFRSPNDPPLTNTLGFGSFDCQDCIPDPNCNAKTVRELYEMSNDTVGKYSVPILFDKKEKVIVNNESSEIVKILNKNFNEFAKNKELDLELHPEKQGEVNDWIYPKINNGVYKCGFATTQEAYDEAFENLFNHLDKLEDLL